ncbi:FMN-binding protein [Bariatricus sp. SGI.154]|uniref:FMN-binding protein n=1 Tax=Bariatricus sp. SGI.154 TaxID=3420549 RepID=UPI003CFD1CCC
MSSKTKIVVLHMKEIIYTVVFAALAIILILLLVFMFLPKNKEAKNNEEKYMPGVYTSTVTLNNTALEVEVTVDESHINSIRFSNLDETVATMYPLIQPTIEEIAEQVYDNQSLENIQYSEENPYTSQIIVNAIDEALKKAETTE